MSDSSPARISLKPIATVRTNRDVIRDDFWGGVESVIEFDEYFPPEALKGLDTFSHIEVVYHFDRLSEHQAHTGARHPRNRKDWPLTGIFAQRAKSRPNRLGVSRCRVISVQGRRLTVADLDALDGTPVLDVKPWIKEFGPRGETRQPAWCSELMKDYYSSNQD